jgi:hypothetical protein
MRFSNPPAYTITGSLSTNVELSSRAIMFTNAHTANTTTSITADVWITQNPGTRDTAEYGDYDSRTYKSVSFTVNVRAGETLILPLALKKVTSLSLGTSTTAYVLI